MNTLDQDIVITVNGFTAPTSGTYTYKVEISEGTLSDFETIFLGNCWLNEDQTSKDFFVNDIIENCRNGFDKALGRTSSYSQDITIYEKIRVSVKVGDTYYRNNKIVYFGYNYPNMKDYLIKNFYDRESMPSSTPLYNLLQGNLVPHIPYKDTSNFTLPVAFQRKSGYNTPLYYIFTGGVQKEDEELSYVGNAPKLKGLNLHSLFQWTYSNETDSLLSVYSKSTPETSEHNTWISSTISTGSAVMRLSADSYKFVSLTTNTISIETGLDNYYPIGTLNLSASGSYDSGWVYVNFDNIDERGDIKTVGLFTSVQSSSVRTFVRLSNNYYSGPKMVKVTFDYTKSNGDVTMTNMQVKVKNTYLNATEWCYMEADNSGTWDPAIGGINAFRIYQPLNGFEVWDYSESIYLGDFDDIYSTTTTHFISTQTEINFDLLDEKKLLIWGSCTGANGYIEISCDRYFTGRKKVVVEFDYIYYDDQYSQYGEMTNIKISLLDVILTKQCDVAYIDYCPAKYYLVWQDRYGGYQSQPFTGTETFTEGFEYTTTINYKNEKAHSIVNVQPKWKIQTGWLNKTLYPYYESIFTSKEVMLYDSINNKSYVCIVTDSNYTEKTHMNQGRKLFNLQLNIEQNKKQKMLY